MNDDRKVRKISKTIRKKQEMLSIDIQSFVEKEDYFLPKDYKPSRVSQFAKQLANCYTKNNLKIAKKIIKKYLGSATITISKLAQRTYAKCMKNKYFDIQAYKIIYTVIASNKKLETELGKLL